MSVPTAPATVHVVVSYATAQQEIVRALALAQGATVGDAIAASGILAEMARLAQAGTLGNLADPRDPGTVPFDPALHQVGVFGKKRPLESVLRDGDRVELYRPLLADPKESRRRRAGTKA
ncbi:RnfH family protein [Massilia sp. DWR3-1-1]|uniref:RnfH family protein n=1 Tax=Massilia sp. DWR3-1-1 TaxID=2804559 RepID=UPI003CFB9F40